MQFQYMYTHWNLEFLGSKTWRSDVRKPYVSFDFSLDEAWIIKMQWKIWNDSSRCSSQVVATDVVVVVVEEGVEGVVVVVVVVVVVAAGIA